jgi:hypothetical protein
MRVNVFVNHEWAIPKTALITGIPEEEIRAKFDECRRFGKSYVFNVEMTPEQFLASKEIANGP